MKFCFVIFFVFYFGVTNSQSLTFGNDVAPIVFKNCSYCHCKGGVGVFPFENYAQVKSKSMLIKYALTKGIMPPWKADSSYTHFQHERVISQHEINTVVQWINNGMPRGEEKTYKYPKNEKNKLGKPDIVIKLSKPVMLAPNNKDKFTTYIQLLDFKEIRYLKAIEIVPSNKKVLHHCRVDFTVSNNHLEKTDRDGFIETNLLEGIPLPEFSFVGDYVPGISPYIYPEKIGYRLPQKVNILINLHYSPVTIPEKDQTEVRLYFYKDTTGITEVAHFCTVLSDKDIEDKKLFVAANTIDCFALKSKKMNTDVEVISVQPHMHLIGQKMKVYALSEDFLDTIPLCNIKDWDFNWQENYYFKNNIVVPKGYVFCAEACYDNTNNNPRNPNIPPQDIYFNGDMKTTNEMLEFYLQLIKHQ